MTCRCRLCGDELDREPLIVYENMPESAQGMPYMNELSTDQAIDLKLYQCGRCGLIQFDCGPVEYYRDVIRSIGFSSTLPNIRRKEFGEFIKRFNLFGKKVVEIGAGQGEYLSILAECGVDAYGIENNENLVESAKEKGLKISKCYLEDKRTIIAEGPYDAFVCVNYLEHQPNPNDFLQGICSNIVEGGVGFITVPDFHYILNNNGFYEFIHDHLVNYTYETFRLILETNGFWVVDYWVSNEDTLCAFVRKKEKVNVEGLIDNQICLKKAVYDFLNTRRYGKIAIWGASHQSFTIIQSLAIYDLISCIIDSADFKQGRYSPASHIPIIGPNEIVEWDIDSIIIIAPSYTSEITNIIISNYVSVKHIAAIKNGTLYIVKE